MSSGADSPAPQVTPLRKLLKELKEKSAERSSEKVSEGSPRDLYKISRPAPLSEDAATGFLKNRSGALRKDAAIRGYVPPTMRGDHPMTGLLRSVIGGMNSSEQILESLSLAYWPRATGPQAAAATQADSVRDGVLMVRTRSSVWSHELTLHKAHLIQSLNRMLGARVIRDIVFRAQGVKKAEVPEPEIDTPEAEELAAVVLDPDEILELRASHSRLASIPNERVREAIAARITSEAKLRHWRLERGWKLCIRCSYTHKTPQDICPHCRVKG